MSLSANVAAHRRLIKANNRIRTLRRKLDGEFMGRRVQINSDKRGTHSRRRYKSGTEFAVYSVIVEGGDICVWLSRVDESPPSFELSVWLHEVTFLPNPKVTNGAS